MSSLSLLLQPCKIAAEKWAQTMVISWSNQMAYKLNFVLLTLGPTVVFFFVKYNLWSSIYAMESVDSIQSYDLRAMLAYQAWIMAVTLLCQSYNGMQLAEDIRLGRISAFLVYPFGFWQFHGASFLAFQVGQILITLVTISSLSLLGMITLSLGNLFLGFYFCFLVSLIWFSMQFLLGVIAFWLEETWVLRVMFVIVCQFLSGAIIPLEIYPQWLTKAMGFSPFPYLTFVPVKILMGTYEASLFPVFGLSPLMQASVILIFWLLVIHITGLLIWRRGIRLYTAAGM